MAEHAAMESKIPRFSSIEEEAEFWDTHDSTEYEDEFEPVELRIADPLRHGLVVEFESATFHRLVAAAKRRGIGPAALAHHWIAQALEHDESG